MNILLYQSGPATKSRETLSPFEKPEVLDIKSDFKHVAIGPLHSFEDDGRGRKWAHSMAQQVGFLALGGKSHLSVRHPVGESSAGKRVENWQGCITLSFPSGKNLSLFRVECPAKAEVQFEVQPDLASLFEWLYKIQGFLPQGIVVISSRASTEGYKAAGTSTIATIQDTDISILAIFGSGLQGAVEVSTDDQPIMQLSLVAGRYAITWVASHKAIRGQQDNFVLAAESKKFAKEYFGTLHRFLSESRARDDRRLAAPTPGLETSMTARFFLEERLPERPGAPAPPPTPKTELGRGAGEPEEVDIVPRTGNWLDIDVPDCDTSATAGIEPPETRTLSGEDIYALMAANRSNGNL